MKILSVDESTWSCFLQNCTGATFFHTPDWYKIWQKTDGLEIGATMIEFESGRAALFPFCVQKRFKGLAKQYISSPQGTYGGFVTAEPLSTTEIKYLEAYLRKINLLQLCENPFNRTIKPNQWSREDFTQVINLQHKWEAVFKSWTKGHASAARKGLREGVEVVLAKNEDWKKYFELYQLSIKRWPGGALVSYNWELFTLLQNLNKENCKLWLAWHQGRLLAGCLCFYFNQHVVYWHGAGEEASFHLKPVHVLQYQIIKAAISQGYKWYDFNPSGGLKGVVHFKNGFGTEVLKIGVIDQEKSWLSDLSKRTRKIKNRL